MALSEELHRRIIRRMEAGKIPIFPQLIRQKSLTRYKAEKQAELRRRQAARKVEINAERRARARREAEEKRRVHKRQEAARKKADALNVKDVKSGHWVRINPDGSVSHAGEAALTPAQAKARGYKFGTVTINTKNGKKTVPTKATAPSPPTTAPPKHKPTPKPTVRGVQGVGGHGTDFAVAESIPMDEPTPEQQFKKGFEGLFTRGVAGVSTVLTSLHPDTVARKAVESITGKVETELEKVKDFTGVSARKQRKEVAKEAADVKTIESEYKEKGWLQPVKAKVGDYPEDYPISYTFVGSPEYQAQVADITKRSAGMSPHIKDDVYTHPAVVEHTKKWTPYIKDDAFVGPAITRFEQKWASSIEGGYFTGTKAQHTQYLKEADIATRKQATQHAQYLNESDIAFGKQKGELAAYHGAIAGLKALEPTHTERYESLTKEHREYKIAQKEYERLHGLSLMGRYKGAEKRVSKFIGGSKTAPTAEEQIKIVEQRLGHPLSDWEKKTMRDIYKDAPKAEKYYEEDYTGFVPGIYKEAYEEAKYTPLKFGVTAVIFAGLPFGLKGVSAAAKPIVSTGTKILPRAMPWVAKWTPRVIGGGLTSLYGGSAGYEFYKAPTYEAKGRVTGKTILELEAMGIGTYVGIKALPYMAKLGTGYLKMQRSFVADTSGAFARKDPMKALRKKWASEQIGRDAKIRGGEWKPIKTRGGILIQKMIPALEGKAKLRVGHRKAKLQTRTTTKAKQKARDRARAGKRKYLGEVGEYDAGTRKAIEMERARMIKAQQEPAWYLRKAKRAEITQTHKESMAEISKAVQKGRQDYWLKQKAGTKAGLMFVSKIGFMQVSGQEPIQQFKQVQQEAQESIATTVQKARHVPISMFGVASRYATEQASSTKQAQLYLSGLIAEIGVATKQVQIQKAKETTVYEKTLFRESKITKPKAKKPVRVRTTRQKPPFLLPFAWEDDEKKKKKRKKGKAKRQWEWLEEFTVQLPHELHFGAIESGIPKVSKVVMLPQVSMAGIVKAIKPKTKRKPKKRTTKTKKKNRRARNNK